MTDPIARTLARMLGFSALLFAAIASAQDYPNRPIRFIVPFSAGGGSDVMARIIAEPLSKGLGQPVVVENKPGANATIGAEHVVKAPADGYTLLYTPPGPQITNPSLMANHLAGEYFSRVAGIEIVHVPYKGSGPAMQDLIAGNVQMAFDTLAALRPHLKSGALRALAIAGPHRSPMLTGVPALAEDIEDFDASPLSYVSVRAGTPAAVVERVNREVNTVLKMPDVVARLAELGIAVSPAGPDDIARQVASERAKWKKVIEASGTKLE